MQQVVCDSLPLQQPSPQTAPQSIGQVQLLSLVVHMKSPHISQHDQHMSVPGRVRQSSHETVATSKQGSMSPSTMHSVNVPVSHIAV